MDDDTRRLFNRVAEKLGWSDNGGLETTEEQQLIKSIGKTRRPATGSHRTNEAQDLHSPLHLLDSEEENDGCSEKENQARQESVGNTFMTTMESSDDDFDQFLVEQTTPKAALQKTCSAVKKVSEPVLVLSSDSDGSFENFLSRVKTPKPKPKKVDSPREHSLKNFIVHSFSSDDDDFVMEKKKTPASKGSSKTLKPSSSSQPLIRKPLSLWNSPVFLSDSDDDEQVAVKSTWRTRHTKRQPAAPGSRKPKVEQSQPEDDIFCSSPTPDAYHSSSPPLLASSYFAPTPFNEPPQRTHSAPSILEDSASSEEEFLTLLERIKKTPKTAHTPTTTQNTRPNPKPPLSTQRTNDVKGAGPVGRTPLDMKTPVRLPIIKPKVSQTEPRLQTSSGPCSRASATLCKTPGCFLQSLSGPDSSYNRNFKQTKEELTSKLFRLYNASVFDGKLPGNMSVSWNTKMRKTAGHCITGQERGGNRYARIELSQKVCDSADRLRDTLVHEMCHAATWLINNVRDGHGPFWKLYARKATLAHPELPMVTRCHSYDINYKYQYRCSRCENTIGRHSKSLDTQRFVCALCTGQLVLLNPAKPRAPTPFANFVKENYGNVRQELVGQSHGEVMRKLSADFATKTKLI